MTGAMLFLALSAPMPAYYGVPGIAASYQVPLDYWADQNMVPRGLASRLVQAESGFRPEAVAYQWEERKGRWYRTTRVLANGMAMVSANPKHLAEHLERVGLTDYDWRDPSDSLRVGMGFLGYLLRYFGGEWRPSVAGYNSGRARAAAWWRGERSLPAETRKYLKTILGGTK